MATNQSKINILARVYYSEPKTGTYLVSLDWGDMHINSIAVKPSKFGNWWVEMPKSKKPDGTFVHHIEFPRVSRAKDLIEKASIQAVEAYQVKP